MALDLKERAPTFIRTTPLWRDFLDAVTTELNLLKTEIAEKADYLNIDEYTDIDDLKALSLAFGYDPILTIQGEDLDYLKREVEAIVFKIKNKGTLYYYWYIFNLIPYSGNVYSLLANSNNLLHKAIDISSTITNLTAASFSEPFTGIASIVEESYTYNNKYGIDAYLDYLADQSSEPVYRTKHLNIEYAIEDILTVSGTEYLMTDSYLRYLDRAVDYGRKATTYPHIGAQLNILMGESGYFDTYNEGGTYSVPDLKLSSSVNEIYITLPRPVISLDESEVLDSPVQWYLDNDDYIVSSQDDSLLLYYLYAGTGTKDLIPISDVYYYTLSTDLIFYLPFDKEAGRQVEDLSDNEFTTTIIGNYSYVDGIVDQSLSFDGTTETQTTSFNILDGIYTYLLWIRGAHASQTGTPYIYYHNGLLEIWYDTNDMKLYVKLTGSVSNITLSANIAMSSGVDNFILIEQDTDSDTVELYINNSLADSGSLVGLGTFSSGSNLYLGSMNGTNYFVGLIDELRVYNKVLTANQRNYFYTEKSGTLAYLNNQIYTQTIQAQQRYSGSQWKIVQSNIPAKAINYEYLEEGDGSTQVFSGTLSYPTIEKNFVDITYTSGSTEYTLTDDGAGDVGTLTGSGATGTINYTTGAYTLTMYRDYSVALEYLYQGESRSTFSYTTDNFPVLAGTVEITYWISGVECTATDDGAGNITGDYVSSGSITYATGVISVTLSQSTDGAEDIYMAYDYRVNTIPDDDTFVFGAYRTGSDLQITEVGVADINGKVVAYATFPPIQFENVNNHLSIQFCIRKVS